jgi:uncharacterized protein YndB with AHSA1/START domain
MRPLIAALALAATGVGLAAPTETAASIVQQDERGFRIIHIVETDASPAAVWRTLVDPAKFWNPTHSFSGDAGNLSLVAAPGGCFCETADNLGVEHARVIYIEPGVRLRLRGSLGPLQQDAVTGILTFVLRERETGGTTISIEYSVSGNFRGALPRLAAAVDGVISEQGNRLGAAALGGAPGDGGDADEEGAPVTDEAVETSTGAPDDAVDEQGDDFGEAFGDTPEPRP